ncbi:MAG: winged helix-turn-helix domain-containing protein [Candidatus Pacebacteria bacterium]|nr:winged helix-turn-helix domain-containing protein [Candidatus Paceibacterota bacterium]
MNYIILIIVGITGIIIGSYFGSKNQKCLIFGQRKRKQENKEKILEFLQNNQKITNNDVEKLCGVSDSTAERYLNELEKEGKIRQIGTVGHTVYYHLI